LDESILQSSSLLTLELCNLLAKEYQSKSFSVIKVKVSISSTFYVQLFPKKSALLSFSLITVRLCNLLAKEYWRKSCL